MLVVDDHPITRAGLVGLIGSQPDLEVAGEAASPGEAMGLLESRMPDLVITDLTMPGRGGIDLIRDLKASHPGLPVLVVSMHDESVYGERALRAGARGYLMKDAGALRILEAVRIILGGRVFVSPELSSRLFDGLTGRRPRGSSSPVESLSDREFEVFQLMGLGRSIREIAVQLHLSPKTVDVHRAHIREKMRFDSLPALARYAVQWVGSERDFR